MHIKLAIIKIVYYSDYSDVVSESLKNIDIIHTFVHGMPDNGEGIHIAIKPDDLITATTLLCGMLRTATILGFDVQIEEREY